MNNLVKISAVYSLSFLVFIAAGLSYASLASAQTLSVPDASSTEKEPEKPSAPRVFSSRLQNTEAAQTLDVEYYNLQQSLWNISEADEVHEKKLMDAMIAEKFRYSRRTSEFKPAMNAAMSDLNRNYKSINSQIMKLDEQFSSVLSSLSEEDQKTGESLWTQKKAEFINLSDDYFKSQNKYLTTYKKIVDYIMTHAGGYYYDSNKKRVAFYNVGEYTFFAETLDSLNKIAYTQKNMMQKIRPSLEDE